MYQHSYIFVVCLECKKRQANSYLAAMQKDRIDMVKAPHQIFLIELSHNCPKHFCYSILCKAE